MKIIRAHAYPVVESREEEESWLRTWNKFLASTHSAGHQKPMLHWLSSPATHIAVTSCCSLRTALQSKGWKRWLAVHVQYFFDEKRSIFYVYNVWEEDGEAKISQERAAVERQHEMWGQTVHVFGTSRDGSKQYFTFAALIA